MLAAPTVTNTAAPISVSGSLTIMANNLTNTNSPVVTQDLNVASFTPGSPLSLTSANGLVLTAPHNVNLGYNNASQISVSGIPINAGTDVSVNGGTNAVSLTPTSIGGTLVGGGAGNLAGSSVNVSVSSGTYSVGALNSPGAITLANTDNSAGNGNIFIIGTVASSASTIGIVSGSLGEVQVGTAPVTAGGLSTTSGNGITIQGGSGGVWINTSVSTNSVNTNAGNISINTTGTVTLNLLTGATITAQSSGSSGNGGTINVSGSSFSFPGSGLATVNASSTATNGNGGTISLTTTGSDLTTGPLLSLLANGAGTGNGGTINLTAFNNLTVGAGVC